MFDDGEPRRIQGKRAGLDSEPLGHGHVSLVLCDPPLLHRHRAGAHHEHDP